MKKITLGTVFISYIWVNDKWIKYLSIKMRGLSIRRQKDSFPVSTQSEAKDNKKTTRNKTHL